MALGLGSKAFRAGEWLSYSAGIVLSGIFVVHLAQGEVDRRQGIAEFEQAGEQLAMLQLSAPMSLDPASYVDVIDPADFEKLGDPDTTAWAPGRIADYRASLQAELPPVLGVLEVPSIELKVPVYANDSDLSMDRGAGIINGMAFPHEPGNIGISGHRDGYFRALKDIRQGDRILLQTLEGPKQFTVDNLQVVEISDVSLLQDTRDQTVTLVTCYPFYFVGHAPQRFIVTASLDIHNVNQNQRRN
jgi:LPXTG-site transpeptidase (sortase) family protein